MTMRDENFEQSTLAFAMPSAMPEDVEGTAERFRQFVPVEGGDSNALSHLIELWAAVPKYCMERQQQMRLRSDSGNLESVTRSFEHRGQRYTMLMHPARIEDPESGRFVEYFPTPADEVIEHLLIKLFTRADAAHVQRVRNELACLVRFRFRDLWTLMKEAGCERNYAQLRHSLQVLSQMRLTIKSERGDSHSEAILASLSEPADADGYFVARFHTVIAGAIAVNEYRQFPLDVWLTLRSSPARWLLTQMCQKRDLGIDRPLETTVSAAETAGVTQAARFGDRLKAMHRAVDELREHGLVGAEESACTVRDIRDENRRRVDCVFRLTPTRRLISHAVAANVQAKNRRNGALPASSANAVNPAFHPESRAQRRGGRGRRTG